MAHNEIEGNVIGEVWRAQEAAKEITYFVISGEENWFRIEYSGDLMLERVNYMAEKLKSAAQSGNSIEVGVDHDLLTIEGRVFNLVKYVQVRA